MTAVTALLAAIAGIGRDARSGGYVRPVFSNAERDLRGWFLAEAAQRGLEVEVDRNGILWAWWGLAGPDAVVTGSHLDSVPGGGAFDGPLGVAAAFGAVDVLRERGFTPARSLAIAVFPEEEGSRFGVACLGSRLLTGALSPDAARTLTDRDGNTLADVFAAGGIDPRWIGPDPETLARIGVFVELHVEQGRGLIDFARPFAVAESILGHGRFKVSVRGEGNHAGTTLMADRRDPVVAAAAMVGAIAEVAGAIDDARATVGRFEPVPGGTNVIASSVDFWIDARHPDDAVTRRMIADIDRMCGDIAAARGCEAVLVEESWSPTVGFDPTLAGRLGAALADAPHLRTGAGHDAGILASAVPTGMLFVRNPSGISHSPEEYVTDADADASAAALADALQELLS